MLMKTISVAEIIIITIGLNEQSACASELFSSNQYHYFCQGGCVLPGICQLVCLIAISYKNYRSWKLYQRCIYGQDTHHHILAKKWKILYP